MGAAPTKMLSPRKVGSLKLQIHQPTEKKKEGDDLYLTSMTLPQDSLAANALSA